MKSLWILFSSLVFSICAWGQQETLARFRITEAKLGNTDASQYYFNRKQYFAFYVNEDKEMMMANVSGTTDEQSYGRLYSMDMKEEEETDQHYKTQTFSFRWNYHNNYDKETGYASVALIKIYKPQGVIFVLRMVLPNLEVSEYKGYMEGTIDFKDYFKN
jgi:hypothetical protein